MSAANTKAIEEFTIPTLNRLIEAISRGQAKTAKDIGNAIMCALWISMNGGGAGGANALIKCLRKSTKLTAIVDILEAKGNLGYLASGKNFAAFDAGKVWPKDKAGVEELRKECMAWEDFKAPAKVEPLDVAEKLEALVSSVAKAQKSGREVLNQALIADVSALIAAFHNKIAQAKV